MYLRKYVIMACTLYILQARAFMFRRSSLHGTSSLVGLVVCGPSFSALSVGFVGTRPKGEI